MKFNLFLKIVFIGEVRVQRSKEDFDKAERWFCKEVGFTSDEVGLDWERFQVKINVHSKDANFSNAVLVEWNDIDTDAGDQGIMIDMQQIK